MEEEHYYIVAYNTEVTLNSDGIPDTAEINIEAYRYCGNATDHFTEMMTNQNTMDRRASEVLNHVKLRARMNPQRNIRIYGIKSTVEPELFEKWVKEMPAESEKLIKEKGVKL